MLLLAKTGLHRWQRVISYSADGCLLDEQELEFEQVFAEAPAAPAGAAEGGVFARWSQLFVPLPHPDVPCHGYALTYPAHRREMRMNRWFRFEKRGAARLMEGEIACREHLDYEAEVGLLLRRDVSSRFGFCLLNDFTDRGIQVIRHSFSKRGRAEVFSAAKSFDGALLLGPLLGLGTLSDWYELEMVLSVNGQPRQHLRARECTLSPVEIHRQLCSEAGAPLWLLAATGTCAGVILQTPGLAARIGLLWRAGLSPQRAKRMHLSAHVFLKPGDIVEVTSSSLGRARTRVTAAAQPAVTAVPPLGVVHDA